MLRSIVEMRIKSEILDHRQWNLSELRSNNWLIARFTVFFISNPAFACIFFCQNSKSLNLGLNFSNFTGIKRISQDFSGDDAIWVRCDYFGLKNSCFNYGHSSARACLPLEDRYRIVMYTYIKNIVGGDSNIETPISCKFKLKIHRGHNCRFWAKK